MVHGRWTRNNGRNLLRAGARSFARQKPLAGWGLLLRPRAYPAVKSCWPGTRGPPVRSLQTRTRVSPCTSNKPPGPGAPHPSCCHLRTRWISPPLPGPEPQGSPFLLLCAPGPYSSRDGTQSTASSSPDMSPRGQSHHRGLGLQTASTPSTAGTQTTQTSFFYLLTASWTSIVRNQETPLQKPFCPSLQLLPSPQTEYLASTVLVTGLLSAPPAELLFTLMPPLPKLPYTLCQDIPVF